MYTDKPYINKHLATIMSLYTAQHRKAHESCIRMAAEMICSSQTHQLRKSKMCYACGRHDLK